MQGKRVLLIITGGIAAVKMPELIRGLRAEGAHVRCVLTKGGKQFVTPLSLAALSEDKVYDDLFSLTDEHEMGHINLSREADVVLVAPASGDVMAKMAHGLASDLATTVLLATDKPVLVAPSMNVRMWEHAATQSNVDTLVSRGVQMIGPVEGDMACGEFGMGRMSEPNEIIAALHDFFSTAHKPLCGMRALVTSGPTHEPIDPVRYIANRSSGKQGHAIAHALAALGCETTLVSGPTALPDPAGVTIKKVETAEQMLNTVTASLPTDIAVFAAAVADWRTADSAAHKIKKKTDAAAPVLTMTENPDVLATVSKVGNQRPRLVIGFAAETENVIENAAAKRARKGCDWIVANDVSAATGTFSGDDNTVHLITPAGQEDWPTMSKQDVADRLAARIAAHFNSQNEAAE